MIKLSRNRLAMIASLNLQNISFEKVVNIWIKYETGIHRSIKNNGKQHTLELYKECYKFLRNTLLKLPTQPIMFCKVDSLGIPKPLWSLRPLIKRNESKPRRLALSIARSYELIKLEIDYSCLDNVTDDHSPQVANNVRTITKKFNRFLTRFTHNRKWYLGSLTNPTQPWSKVLTTLSKGPNGPAVATAHLDAKAVIADTELFESLTVFNSSMKQEWITEWLIKQSKSVKGSKKYLTGRLGFSSEPAGKTRLFAIGDYWSQLSLKPLQISLQRTLENISMDATSDQNGSFAALLKGSIGHPTYCFDLSSASDRIPAIMQKKRLELMGGKILGDSWYQIMTKRDFFVKAEDKSVRWKIGQPLGLLSSFPSFALWHHDIIQFAANWKNIHNGKPLRLFKQYCLLGDDVVIYNKEVAQRYQWLLKKIGLNINLDKSVIGDKENSQIEFTKRLALKGKEMSSIKRNILTKNDKLSLLDLVELLHERDFISPDAGHHDLYQVFNSDDLLRLQFMLWLRTSDTPVLVISNKDGNVILEFNRQSVMQCIMEKRTANIIKKATEVKALDMEREFPNLVKSFKSAGVLCDEKALADRSIGDLSGSHPIVLGLTQTSRELQFLMFDVLDELDPNAVSPVEYLPVVSTKSYFNDRKTVNRYFSKILLESLQVAIDDYNQLKDINCKQGNCTGK